MHTLETKRLILRGWTVDDAEDLYDYAKDVRVGPEAGWAPHADISVSKRIIESFIQADDVYAIELRESHKVVGSIGLHQIKREEELADLMQREIGYVLHPNYWGNGYIVEGVKAVLEYGFKMLDTKVIWCCHFEGNERSRRVIEKCQFRYSFTEKQRANLVDEQEKQSLCYCITWKEYEQLY